MIDVYLVRLPVCGTVHCSLHLVPFGQLLRCADTPIVNNESVHRGRFLRNWNLLSLYIGLLIVFIFINCSRRNVNIVSHLLPVSVWSIVSKEIIMLPAEVISLLEEAT